MKMLWLTTNIQYFYYSWYLPPFLECPDLTTIFLCLHFLKISSDFLLSKSMCHSGTQSLWFLALWCIIAMSSPVLLSLVCCLDSHSDSSFFSPFFLPFTFFLLFKFMKCGRLLAGGHTQFFCLLVQKLNYISQCH